MKQTKQQRKDWLYKLFLKVALVVVSTILIVYFMPRGTKQSNYYEINTPWRYGNVIADFKFPIDKDSTVMNRERDSVLRKLHPYFNIDRSFARSTIKRIMNSDMKAWQIKDAFRYAHHVSTMLDTLYSHGIMTVENYNMVKDNRYSQIHIVSGTESTTVPFSHIFSTHTAYEYMINRDTVNFQRKELQKLNLNTIITANLTYDQERTDLARQDLLSSISPTSGMVQIGEKIIGNGDIVDQNKFNKLNSYYRYGAKSKNEDSQIPYSLIGQLCFVSLLLISLITYLNIFRADYYDKLRSALLLFLLITTFCIIASCMIRFFGNTKCILALPCCMVPIIIRVFMDSRTAFMFHCAMVLIISTMLESPYEFIVLQLITGMIAIQSLRELSQRAQILRTAALIAGAYMLSYTAYELINSNSVEHLNEVYYEYFILNGFLLLLLYPLLYGFEKGFGFISDVTLVELSNINNPLLQRMTEIAPGTFQHSMQVSNLASEVAKKIGGRVQLVRTGALYHDIGKMERPVFFTENQNGISPHKHLTPLKSAEVIIAHVTNGLALASKHNLPESIKRFIATHHGLGMAKFFYITYKNEHPDEEIDESLFTYPGPNPETKEEAILMMCDSVEAASRSLPEYTEESISQLVDRIIDGQMTESFYRECDISFRDIDIAKSVLKDKLKTIYHTRISYPELEKAKKTNEQQQPA